MTEARGSRICRGCGSDRLESVLDLGSQPLANELLASPEDEQASFPLHLMVCPQCALGQVGEFVTPARLFSDYRYLSSMSSGWLAHTGGYAQEMCRQLSLGSDDLVIEVASNDGHLLKSFQAAGVDVLGIEPAKNIAAVARAAGVPTVERFFGRSVADELVAEGRSPSLVVANNVMAHVPDLHDFVAGLAALCGPDTVVTVENPSFSTLLQETQFDTIYHEHYSYLSAHAVSSVVSAHGLELVKVQRLATHGGSLRYWFMRQGSASVDDSVHREIAGERRDGLLDPRTWDSFSRRSRATVEGLRQWLDVRRAAGSSIAGYGAAAKGNTLLNAAAVTASDIDLVADVSPEKQGWWLPGSRIPVVAPAELSARGPDDVLVLPWNLAAEIVPFLQAQVPLAACWAAIPAMRRLTT